MLVILSTKMPALPVDTVLLVDILYLQSCKTFLLKITTIIQSPVKEKAKTIMFYNKFSLVCFYLVHS